MKRSLLVAAALLLVAPAHAATWVVYHSGYGSDGKNRSYQIDAASIVKYNGWVHANERVCLAFDDCFRTYGVSAQCKQNKLRPTSLDLDFVRRNGKGWWTEVEIADGKRMSWLKEGSKRRDAERSRRIQDAQQNKLFDFLCS